MSNPILRDIKAALFDVDNTLLATHEFMGAHLRRTVRRLKNKGLKQLSLPSEQGIQEVLSQNIGFDEFFQKVFKGKSGKKPLWEIVLEEYRKDSYDYVIPPTPGALDAIRFLKEQGIVIGIVTNRLKGLTERLEQSGFTVTDFSILTQPPAPEHKKPHPNAFTEALKHLKQLNIHPDQVVMFGDHTDDYYGASYHNIRFVGVLHGATPREEFLKHYQEDELLVTDLGNMQEILATVVRVHAYRTSITNTSAIDGRHAWISSPLRHYFSEYALHRYRIHVEVEHVIALSEEYKGSIVRTMSRKEKEFLRSLAQQFSPHEAYEVLQYDHLHRNGIGPTEHDVKSCELWIREKLQRTSLEDVSAQIHLLTTSEDINNLAYKRMVSAAVTDVVLPSLQTVMALLAEEAKTYQNDPLMGRTHMQPASPTTFGKIFAGYLSRMLDGMERLSSVKLTGKINGAVGNYNAFIAAYPDTDWISYSQRLCERLGLECELITDQRGTHADMIRAFQALQEINNVLRDLATDLSLYAGIGSMYFSTVATHVGSSVMPHKVNPWFAEVAESNATKANYLINCFSNELDVSRLQRDLSDHDYERSYGEALGYMLVTIEHIRIALTLVKPDTATARKELRRHPEVVTEAIQTILRKYGRTDAYDALKVVFRGKRSTTVEDLQTFVKKLKIALPVKKELMAVLDPEIYVGLAPELTELVLKRYQKSQEPKQ